MSDLSRLLDDVYGDRAADAPAAAPELPEEQVGQQDWSADAVLDDAFADWVTDPATSAPDEHHEPVGHLPGGHLPGGHLSTSVTTSPRGVPRSSFTDLAEEPVTAAVVAPVPSPQAKTGWHRDDDDILPTGRRRRSMRARSTSPAAAPSAASPGAAAAVDLPGIGVTAGAEQPPEPTSRRFRLGRG